MGKLLTITEVAEILRIHRSSLYRMIRLGEIPYFRIGNSYRFDSEALERWIASKAGWQWNPSESKSSVRPLLFEKK